MNKFGKFSKRLTGFTDAIVRYPLSVAFLLAATVMNAYTIEVDGFHSYKFMMTFGVGVMLAAVVQMIYEHFSIKETVRWIMMFGAVILTLCYYFSIFNAPEDTMEVAIKSGVAIFALWMAFIWIPTIKSKIDFNESFLSAFKGFFVSLLLFSVMYIGIILILAAINVLLISIRGESYAHTANIVYILFGVTYFLSLTPHFPKIKRNTEELSDEELELEREVFLDKSIECPKLLDILISYIIIPLTGIFTIILILYIVQNIGGSFWEQNLLEPMLVSYAVTVILVYILASTLDNKLATMFRFIFPKVLVPIVLFQTIASILKIREMGVTHGRYYVIIFGIFAIFSGVVFSLGDVRKNGIIALALIVLAGVSILPPVDAFTVARYNQKKMLISTLESNEMLKDGKLIAKGTISEKDKTKITMAYQYLREMDRLDELAWMEEKDGYEDFTELFGFDEYQQKYDQEEGKYIYIYTKDQFNMEIQGYDVFASGSVDIEDKNSSTEEILTYKEDGAPYYIRKVMEGAEGVIQLLDANNKEILRFNLSELKTKFEDYEGDTSVPVEKLTFTVSNDQAEMKLLFQNVKYSTGGYSAQFSAKIYGFLMIK